MVSERRAAVQGDRAQAGVLGAMQRREPKTAKNSRKSLSGRLLWRSFVYGKLGLTLRSALGPAFMPGVTGAGPSFHDPGSPGSSIHGLQS